MTYEKIAEERYPMPEMRFLDKQEKLRRQSITIRERSAFIEGMKESKWISVDDELPDYGVEVLVFGKKIPESLGVSSNPYVVCLSKRIDLSKSPFATPRRRYQDENEFTPMEEVTHWQPLPAPPSQLNPMDHENIK